MANITVNVSNDQLNRVVSALCRTAGLPVNPANAKKALGDYVRDVVIAIESNDARESALGAIVTPIDPGIT